MITLGIESTSHTLGIGIVKDGNIISNVLDTYIPKKGIIPREAADHHSNIFTDILMKSLNEANISYKDIDLIAFSQGPGIGAPLSVGVAMAKYLGELWKLPIIGVNHPVAHILISEYITKLINPLVLFISGANTQIIDKNGDNLTILGETLDLGAGNLFDMLARELNLNPPNGKSLSDLAEKNKDKIYLDMPYSVKGMNVSFSGIHTKTLQYLKKIKKNKQHIKGKIEDIDKIKSEIAYSAMETVFSEVVEITERALLLTNKKEIIVCGGVAQNTRLQEMLKIMSKEDNVKFGVAPNQFNRDNGGMIAFAGEYFYKKYGKTKQIEDWHAKPRFRIEEYLDVYVN